LNGANDATRVDRNRFLQVLNSIVDLDQKDRGKCRT
jgi:hypothetical protein